MASTAIAATARLAASRDLAELVDLVAAGGVVVLSGAGLSTESGIPDYRGDGSRPRRAPMTYRAFVGDPVSRRRYWARAHLGWQHLRGAQPNRGHRAVAEFERRGLVVGTVTQNVDGLHQAAGSRDVVDLHGRLDRVVCLRCGDLLSRATVASYLEEANPGWTATVSAVNPDGDVEIAEDSLGTFVAVDCPVCGGLLKPDVVYVGESVPVDRVLAVHDLVDRARLLLVLGSSLTVWSGRRFVVRAARAGTPVAIVNDGPTRGDELAEVKVAARLGPVLDQLVEQVRETGTSAPAMGRGVTAPATG